MKLVEENKISGVYGPLIELFEADEKFRVAVDVTAGNRCGAAATYMNLWRRRIT